jgi:hypothetical protein
VSICRQLLDHPAIVGRRILGLSVLSRCALEEVKWLDVVGEGLGS